eukprot:11763449-Prorocentrum_lima.AAC.1
MSGPVAEHIPSICAHGTTLAQLRTEGVDITKFITPTKQWDHIRKRSFNDAELIKTCSQRLPLTLTELSAK